MSERNVLKKRAWVFLLKDGISRRVCNLWLHPRNIDNCRSFFSVLRACHAQRCSFSISNLPLSVVFPSFSLLFRMLAEVASERSAKLEGLYLAVNANGLEDFTILETRSGSCLWKSRDLSAKRSVYRERPSWVCLNKELREKPIGVYADRDAFWRKVYGNDVMQILIGDITIG